MQKGKTPRLLIFGALSGLLNGIFGSSGGIIAVASLKSMKDTDDKTAHATSITIILPLCIVSAIIYAFGGVYDWGLTWKVSVGAAAGGFLGAKLLGLISEKWLTRVFCAVMALGGVKMLFG